MNFLTTFFLACILALSCKDKPSPTQSQPPPPTTPPVWSWQFDTVSRGCGNFIAYAFGDSGKASIAVDAKACTLGLDTTSGEIDLAANDSDIVVVVNVYSKDPHGSALEYCNDAIAIDSFPPVITESWRAVSGKASVSADTIPSCDPHCFTCGYQVTIVLDSLVFQKDGGTEQVLCPKFELKDVVVGWFPG
jgi:hypothetical protein